jgi:Phosphate-selective porin O and P
MNATHRNAPRKMTRRWRAVELCATLAGFVVFVVIFVGAAGVARAQPQQPQPQPTPAPIGPNEPVWPRELDALRAQLDAQARAQAERLRAAEESVAALRRALDDERAARTQAEHDARERHEAALRAFEEEKVVHAGRLGVALGGFLQADAVPWRQSSQDQLNPSTGDPINQSRFLIRRARLRADVDWKWVAGGMELDGNTVNGPQARLIGAEASFKWRHSDPKQPPYVMATFGLFKTPFGFEIQQSDRDRLFLERSNLERALFPGEYDLGFRVQGGWRFVRWQLAAMNGDPVGERAFPGRDPNQSKDFVGRVGIDATFRGRLRIAAGFSADYGQGFHKGVPASKDTLTWRDVNEDGAVQLNEIQVIRGASALPSANFSRYAVGGDLVVALQVPRLGELTLYGELVSATNLDRATLIADPVASARDLRELGFYVAATQELTRYGMIGVRYDRYDPDRDANDQRGGVEVPKDSTYSTVAIAGAVEWPGYGRLVIEYDHNTNPLGRTRDGRPTTLADDALTLRAQVQF